MRQTIDEAFGYAQQDPIVQITEQIVADFVGSSEISEETALHMLRTGMVVCIFSIIAEQPPQTIVENFSAGNIHDIGKGTPAFRDFFEKSQPLELLSTVKKAEGIEIIRAHPSLSYIEYKQRVKPTFDPEMYSKIGALVLGHHTHFLEYARNYPSIQDLQVMLIAGVISEDQYNFILSKQSLLPQADVFDAITHMYESERAYAKYNLKKAKGSSDDIDLVEYASQIIDEELIPTSLATKDCQAVLKTYQADIHDYAQSTLASRVV